MKKFSKIFMIFCVLFSQFNGVITVLAEELLDDTANLIDEESSITVSLDDEYNLVVKGNGILDDNSSYDVRLTSSYKYDYDDTEKSGYDEEVINGEEVILGSVFNSEEGYSVAIEGIESVYNGEFSLIVEVVDVVTEDIYSTTVTKKVFHDDKFDVYANEVLVEDGTYSVDNENKEVTYSYDMELNSIMGTVVPSISINDSLLESNDYVVNYEGMLYGTYSYKWDVLVEDEIYTANTILVDYNNIKDDEVDNDSANDEILTTVNTNGVKFVLGNAYVVGEVFVVDFLESINMDAYELKVIDSEENEVTEGTINNGMSLVISKDGLVLTYRIAVVGDVDSDGDVDFDDVTTMVESILSIESEEEYYNASADVNIDGIVDVFDVTKTIYSLNNGWDNEVVIDEETLLNPILSSDVVNEVKIGDTITVRFALNNFAQNMINGLSGKIEFDNTVLSLDEVLVNGMEIYYNDNFEFIIYGDDYNSEEDLIQLTFTAIGASTDEYISISSLVASYAGEEVLLTTDSVSMNFEVTYTSNVGGDTEEDVEEETKDSLVNNVVSPRPVYVLSSDSYLSDLKMEGFDLEFSPYKFNYNIIVGHSVKSLDLEVVLSDYRASYVIYGNEDFKVGENIVTIVVTAEDGSDHTYTLIVDREEEPEVEDKKDDKVEKEENSTSKTIVVVLIILVIIGLIYLIFKDDEEDKKKKD